MAITIRPADGLVTRLLQQQTRSNSVQTQSANPKTSDKVNFSAQARQHTQSVVTQQEGDKSEENQHDNKRQKLESQLIKLYTKHDSADPNR